MFDHSAMFACKPAGRIHVGDRILQLDREGHLYAHRAAEVRVPSVRAGARPVVRFVTESGRVYEYPPGALVPYRVGRLDGKFADAAYPASEGGVRFPH